MRSPHEHAAAAPAAAAADGDAAAGGPAAARLFRAPAWSFDTDEVEDADEELFPEFFSPALHSSADGEVAAAGGRTRRGGGEAAGAAGEAPGAAAEEEEDGDEEEDAEGRDAAAPLLFGIKGEAILWVIDCCGGGVDIFSPAAAGVAGAAALHAAAAEEKAAAARAAGERENAREPPFTTLYHRRGSSSSSKHTPPVAASRTLWQELLLACVSFLRRKLTSSTGRTPLLFGLLLAGTPVSRNALHFPHLFSVPLSGGAAADAAAEYDTSAASALAEVDVKMLHRLQALARLRTRHAVYDALFGAAAAAAEEKENASQAAETSAAGRGRGAPGPPAREAAARNPSLRAQLSDMLWLSSHLFSAAAAPRRRSTSSRRPQQVLQQRLLLLTADDAPCSGPGVGRDAEEAAVQRLRDLQEEGVDFLLVPLENDEKPFVMEKFWSDALMLEDDEEEEEGSRGAAYKRHVRLRMDEIHENIRLVDRAQRVLSLLPLHLLPSLRLAVCLLVSVKNPTPLPHAHVLLAAAPGEQPEELRPGMRLQLVGDRTAASAAEPTAGEDDEERREEEEGSERQQHKMTVDDLLLQTHGPNGGVGPVLGLYTEASGEKIGIEPKDVQAVKQFGEAGIWLLGFKPQDTVPAHLNISSSLFVVPASAATAAAGGGGRGGGAAAARAAREHGVPPGAAVEQEKLFSALVLSMHRRNLAALVRCVMKSGSLPTLAALLPQLEEVDEAGNTLQPPGLHLIRLPFAEEVRSLHLAWPCLAHQQAQLQQHEGSIVSGDPAADSVGVSGTDAEQLEQQVQLAEQMLKGLMAEDFHPQQLTNDALQRHYAIIEALAVGLHAPDVPPPSLEPDKETFDRLLPDILRWKKSVYGTDDASYVPVAAGSRRPPGGASQQTPRRARKADSSSSRPRKRLLVEGVGTQPASPAVSTPRFAAADAAEEGAEAPHYAATTTPRGSAAGGRQRSSSSGRAAAAEVLADEEMRRLAHGNRLASLTVLQLKAWLAARGLAPHGLKADLVRQVTAALLQGTNGSGSSSSAPHRRRSSSDSRGSDSQERHEKHQTHRGRLRKHDSSDDLFSDDG